MPHRQRFDRDLTTVPVRRLHQEDLCQALGLTPDFKYQHPDWTVPSFKALAGLLNDHGARPGADRLAVAETTLFSYLVGNADAHAKNISLLHQNGRVRLAPAYDLVSTASYPDLNRELALAIGDEFDPDNVGSAEWDDFGAELHLSKTAFRPRRMRLTKLVRDRATALRETSLRERWHDPHHGARSWRSSKKGRRASRQAERAMVVLGSTAPLRAAPPVGFEPTTCGLEVRCSIQLSYRGPDVELRCAPPCPWRRFSRPRASRRPGLARVVISGFLRGADLDDLDRVDRAGLGDDNRDRVVRP